MSCKFHGIFEIGSGGGEFYMQKKALRVTFLYAKTMHFALRFYIQKPRYFLFQFYMKKMHFALRFISRFYAIVMIYNYKLTYNQSNQMNTLILVLY